mgnify:CR=1 FL=1
MVFRRDHPRSRGVYLPRCGQQHGQQGSSPLARGLHMRPLNKRVTKRIIPARAGFTRSVSASFQVLTGSSPLARGLPVDREDFYKITRIIPARAGFTATQTGSSRS